VKPRYHAHSEVQRGDGLYGGLVVHNESADGGFYAYDRELLLLVGDWYHRPAEWLLARFQDRTSTGNEVSFSLLLLSLCNFNFLDESLHRLLAQS
jgi:FtsP/CotA-like multicopper oxidase with cupredoxin domain